MSKITVSDFIVALLDLAEAESLALAESAERFMQSQREQLERSLYKSGWMVAWIVAAVTALMGGIAFTVWGLYRLFALYLSESAAPFAAGAISLVCAAIFALLARRARGGNE